MLHIFVYLFLAVIGILLRHWETMSNRAMHISTQTVERCKVLTHLLTFGRKRLITSICLHCLHYFMTQGMHCALLDVCSTMISSQAAAVICLYDDVTLIQH